MKIWNNWKDEFEWNKFKFLIAGPKKSKKMGKKRLTGERSKLENENDDGTAGCAP